MSAASRLGLSRRYQGESLTSIPYHTSNASPPASEGRSVAISIDGYKKKRGRKPVRLGGGSARSGGGKESRAGEGLDSMPHG